MARKIRKPYDGTEATYNPNSDMAALVFAVAIWPLILIYKGSKTRHPFIIFLTTAATAYFSYTYGFYVWIGLASLLTLFVNWMWQIAKD